MSPVPERIAEQDPSITGGLASLLSEADHSVAVLNRLDAKQAGQIEALARQLLRQESLASSRIEGLSLSHKRIGEAAYDLGSSSDHDAKAVLANIDAMHQAIGLGSTTSKITRQTIQDLHRTLMASTMPQIAGQIREKQNWLGGSWHTPIGAEFVPPPADEVERLLDDLAEFMNRVDLPPTLQAAIVHAQFETIHPFADGNGRIGRCLIHVVFKRRSIADHQVPPVSLMMATDVDSYVKALTAYRTDRETDWIDYFARTVIAASDAGTAFARRLWRLQESWRTKAAVRRGSTADRLVDLLPAQPVIDVKTASEMVGTSAEAARVALNRLEDRGVVARASGKRWGRVWEADGLWGLLDRFERGLRTPV